MNCDQATHQIELHLAGESSARQLNALRDHATVCSGCAEQLAETESLVEVLRAGMQPVSQVCPSARPFVNSWVATSRLLQSSRPPSAAIRPVRPMRPGLGGLSLVLFASVILALALALIYRPVEQSNRKNAARLTLAAMQLAILQYHADHNLYPPEDEGGLVRFLDGDPANGGPSKRYFHFLADLLSPDGLQILDPWGRPYHYRVWRPDRPPIHNGHRFDLWSDGVNGERVTNWADIPPPR